MFERFTLKARRAIVVSQDEARTLHHDLIRPEHLLLGLVQGDGIATQALGLLGVNPQRLRATVEETVERSKTDKQAEKVPFSPAAKRALELSLREALRLGHNYIGTEHLLLGTLQVLEDHGVGRLLGVDSERDTSKGARADVGSRRGPPPSRAAADATRLARQLAGSGPMTTGHLILAILNDTDSQASRALGTFGVTPRIHCNPA